MASFSSAAFSTSAFSELAFDFDGGIAPTAAPTLPPLAGGKPDKRLRAPKAYSAHEKARALTSLRDAHIERILAERAAANEATEAATAIAEVAPDVLPAPLTPVSMAGGAVPPIPPATTIGEIVPELALLKANLEQAASGIEDERRRRLLLLAM